MVLRKSFYIRWSAGRSPRVHEVNPGRDPSKTLISFCPLGHMVCCHTESEVQDPKRNSLT